MGRGLVAVSGQDARGIQPLAGRGRGQVPGHRSGAGVLEVVPDPSAAGGHQVACAGVAVQGLRQVRAEFGGEPLVRRGQGGGLIGGQDGMRPGQEGPDVTERREHRGLAGVIAQRRVQVPQHRPDGGLARQRAGRVHVPPERHHLAVPVVHGGGYLRARHHRRDTPPGQEPGDVEFALQPGLGFGADGGGARSDLGHHRRGAQVHDHVRAIGQDHRVGAAHAQAGAHLDGGLGRRRGRRGYRGHRGYGSASAARVPRAALTVVTAVAATTSAR